MGEKPAPSEQRRVIVRHYPKVFFFIPTMIAGYIIWLLLFVFEPSDPEVSQIAATAFLLIFAFNFIIIAFDFGTAKTLAIVLGLLLLIILYLYLQAIDAAPREPSEDSELKFFLKIDAPPDADKNFYFWMSSIMLICFIIIVISSYIEYYEIRSREIIHHFGPFSDAKRWPASDATMYKDIPDLFEFILFRAGNITILPKGRETAIVMENVLNVNKKEKAITELLGIVPVEPS